MEQVWHEGRLGLIPASPGASYRRHVEKGTRSVTQEAYAAEIATAQQDRPKARAVVYDHDFADDRAWFRFRLTWQDATRGEPRTRAGCRTIALRVASLKRRG